MLFWHRAFGTRNILGIVDVLAGEYKLQEVWHEPVPGLKVVNVGPIPPNPAELLGSKRLSDLLANVRKEFDYILIDAPPVGLVSDPAILATQGDGVLLVLDAQHTRKGALRQSVRSLEAVGVIVLGTVMTTLRRLRRATTIASRMTAKVEFWFSKKHCIESLWFIFNIPTRKHFPDEVLFPFYQSRR